jgi:HK97 family phage major capsid protein
VTAASWLELLQDSRIDIEPYINVALATRIARITNRHFTTVSWNIQRPEVR